MLRQFEAVQRIREQFFASSAALPEVKFNVTPMFLDAAAERFVLQLDGERFEYRHGPERRAAAVWPGAVPGVSVSFEGAGGERPSQTFDGPWAWFRLLETAQLQRVSDLRFSLLLQAGTHQSRVDVEASSIRNPFLKTDLRQFHCDDL
jgi:type VI secretion system protein ImpL